MLWIAFRFCIFVLWTQSLSSKVRQSKCCELLSDFVYSFFEHNERMRGGISLGVVNCFQILYIRSLNTIKMVKANHALGLWIAFRFCIFVLWTQYFWVYEVTYFSCELLSDFVYSFFEHNCSHHSGSTCVVVNCFQILYIRSLNTIIWIRRTLSFCCELLSDFVYSFFEHNNKPVQTVEQRVVNCFQILYIRSLNTILR